MPLISRELSIDLQNIKKAFDDKKSAEEAIKSREINIEKEKIAGLKNAASVKIIKYNDFKEDVRFKVLHKGLTRLCENSIRNITPEQVAVCSNIIESYIQENGLYNILRKMKNSRNLFLKELAEEIKDTSEELITNASQDENEDYTINKDTVDKFIKEIDDSEDANDVTNVIRLRVSNAEEDFVNKNERDEENIKTILKDTADRVKNAKEDNDNDYSSAVEESEMRFASKQIYKIQHESRNSAFDRIARAVAKSSLLSAQESSTENNRLNMESVMNVTKAIYTVLEMLSATTLEKVDDEYINDTIKSL